MANQFSLELLQKANSIRDGLAFDTNGTILTKQEGSKHEMTGLSRGPSLDEHETGQDAPNVIKDAFKQIPIIGGLLYNIFHAIFKLFGIDLDEVGRSIGRGGQGISFDELASHAPEWARDGLHTIMKGIEQLQQNPTQFRSALQTIHQGVQQIRESAKQKNVEPSVLKNLDKLEHGMNRIANGGLFSALRGAGELMSAAQGLKQDFLDGKLEPQSVDRGLGMGIGEKPIGKIVDQSLENAGNSLKQAEGQVKDHEHASQNEWGSSVGREQTLAQGLNDLQNGLSKGQKGDAAGYSEASNALRDVSSALHGGDEKQRESMHKSADQLQQMNPQEMKSFLGDIASRIEKQRQQEQRSEGKEGSKDQGKDGGMSPELKAAAKGAVSKEARGQCGKAEQTDHTAKTADATGKGGPAKEQKVQGGGRGSGGGVS